MVKVVLFVFLLFFSSCTSRQIRAIDRFIGGIKVTKSFPIDLNSREKHAYRVHGVERPSILGRGRGGATFFTIALCVDRKDEIGRERRLRIARYQSGMMLAEWSIAMFQMSVPRICKSLRMTSSGVVAGIALPNPTLMTRLKYCGRFTHSDA